MLDTYARKYVQPIIALIANFFLKRGFSANNVTCIAFIIGLLSGVLTYFNLAVLAIIILWISGLLDAVDGTMARKLGSTSYGTVMDITFDRLVEISIIIALALRFQGLQLELIFLLSAILFSMTVFLTTGPLLKKTTEKTFYYQAGIAERTEGFIFFSAIILLRDYRQLLIIFFTVIVIITAIQRMLEAKKYLS